MTDPPEVRISRGSPTPAEEEAVREAILAVWREDIAAARRDDGMNPWVLAARAEATGRAAGVIRGRASAAWRWAGRFDEPVSDMQAGRGDAR